jgi:NAD(P)H-flavin reductase
MALLLDSAPAKPASLLSDPMLPALYRVRKVIRETSDTFTLELDSADGVPARAFAPGQFNMLYVFGVGEVPISISGDPAHPETLVHTTRAVGTVTKVMRELKRGDVIGVRGPYGASWPVDEAAGSDIVLVAGGIGLAPLRPILYRVLAQRARYGKVVLLYGTRTPEDILFREELKRLRARFDLETYITVDRASGSWKGNVGVVTNLVPRAPFDPSSTEAFVCGPEVMMRFALLELERRGVNSDHVWVSLERNMKCAIGHCGHCQFGPLFICRDGPVFRYSRIKDWLSAREL